MKKKKYLIITTLLVIALVLLFTLGGSKNEKLTYTYGKITKGDVNLTVTCSGTLEAKSTVDVGTQVSGKIAKVLVDFNSEVKKGQLLAVIDTVTLSAQVKDAKANYNKVKSEYLLKEILYKKNQQLFEKSYISELDLLQSKTELQSLQASLESANYALERAETNLNYAFIFAPIAGKIIDKNIEEGQTVAASFWSPTLFTIAQDISSMQILASVDESDIGEIKEGQQVKFTVQSFTDKKFEGIVKQIRLKPTNSSNVVNYTVVVDAKNPDKILLPGMTATLDFYITSKQDVLLLPNTALRFQPSETLMTEIRSNMEAEKPVGFPERPDTFGGKPSPLPPFFSDQASDSGNPSSKNKSALTMVYYLDKNGKVKISPFIAGLTDGKNTEIMFGSVLKEGMQIIIGSSENETEKSNGNSILNRSSQNMPPPPMM